MSDGFQVPPQGVDIDKIVAEDRLMDQVSKIAIPDRAPDGNNKVTPEYLEGVKVDEEGIAFASSILEAVLSLKEHGYRVLTAGEADLEQKASEARFDALNRDRMEAVKESIAKDDTIKSLASRITEAMAVLGAFSALSIHAATITPSSLSRILSRVLLGDKSPGERDAFIGTQLSYHPANDPFGSGGCMGDPDDE